MSYFTHLCKRMLVTVCSLALVWGMAACGSTTDETAEGKTRITLWTWQSTIPDFVSAFEKTHPTIEVKTVNVGSNNDEYLQLSNALAANSGIPDIVYLDYNAVQQFAVSGDLRDVGNLGFSSVSNQYMPTALDSIQVEGKYYGLPISAGPMVLFYNLSVFQKAGITQAPTTWDEYREDALKIKKLGSQYFIGNDTGDAGLLSSLLWQAGARPFGVEGNDLTIDFSGAEVRRFATMWQKLLDKKLLDTSTPSWSEEWYKGLQDGTIASVTSGAWMATTLKKNLKDTSGQWRVAELPQYEDGASASSENGGGALALPKGSDEGKVKAAYEFAQWYAHGEGVQINLEQDGIPPLKRVFDDSDYLDAEDAFFGGQKTHQVFATSEKNVLKGWEYLPFMAYANQIAGDSLGQAYTGEVTLEAALGKWQKSLIEYGKQQGFSIN